MWNALPPGVEAVHPEPMEDRRQAKKVTDGVGVWKVEGEKISISKKNRGLVFF